MLRTVLEGRNRNVASSLGYGHIKKKIRKSVEGLLSYAGIGTDGQHPWDIKVNDERFFRRALTSGSLGLGESYMEGWWECKRLDEFFYRVLKNNLDRGARAWPDIFDGLRNKMLNRQRSYKAFHVGRHHYDIGNDLYKHMLDKRLIYSCGYWRKASSLDGAQEAKLKMVCEKLRLKPGMKVLDIGCGWGGAAKYAAQRYRVEVDAITVSERQASFAMENCRGLPVNISLMDYHDIDGVYDRIFSIGMFEHVGYKNYRTFMRIVKEHLKEDGLFLLHTIGNNLSYIRTDPWIERYIFPNSMLPSARQISTAIEGLFVIEDWHNFGMDYDKTLMQWFNNFNKAWDILKKNYDEVFYRMWKYYLLSCAGAFRARRNQLWQIVLSSNGLADGYQSIR